MSYICTSLLYLGSWNAFVRNVITIRTWERVYLQLYVCLTGFMHTSVQSPNFSTIDKGQYKIMKCKQGFGSFGSHPWVPERGWGYFLSITKNKQINRLRSPLLLAILFASLTMHNMGRFEAE